MNSKYLDAIEYPSTPDLITKEITEFISYISFSGPLKEDFEQIENADEQVLLTNALLSTSFINSEALKGQEWEDYLTESGLDYHILREHVEKTSEFLYGTGISLPLESRSSPFLWIESLSAYEVSPRGLNIYNPIVLSIEETETQYEVVAVIPERIGYDDETLYLGDKDPQNLLTYNSLESVIPHCQKRNFVLTKKDGGGFVFTGYSLIINE